MQRSAVLLPEPLRPMMAVHLAAADLEADAFEHLQRAEALVHVVQAHDRRRGALRIAARTGSWEDGLGRSANAEARVRAAGSSTESG